MLPMRSSRRSAIGRVLIGCGLLVFMSLAVARSDSRPISATQPDGWQSVGSADLKVLWFDIYRAELFSPSGRFNGIRGPLLLQLNYRRDIDRERLLSETRSQLHGRLPDRALERRLRQLAALWPDIRAGENLAFYLAAEGSGHFYHNGRWLGVIEDPLFCRAFLEIWLAEDSAYPALARKLRGGRYE